MLDASVLLALIPPRKVLDEEPCSTYSISHATVHRPQRL